MVVLMNDHISFICAWHLTFGKTEVMKMIVPTRQESGSLDKA